MKHIALVAAALGVGVVLVVFWLMLRGPGDDAALSGSGASDARATRPAADLVAAGADAGQDRPVDRTALETEAAPQPVEAAASASAAIDPRRTVVVGRVVDTRGDSVAGAQVTLGASGDPHFRLAAARAAGDLAWERSTESGGDGAFRFADVPSYGLMLLLHVAREGRPSVDLPGVQTVPGDLTDLGDIELSEGARVSGRVVDELGDPVADATVLWTRSFGGDFAWVMMFAEGTEAAVTDAQGAFTVADLPPGELAFSARAARYAAGWSDAVRLADGEPIDELEIVVRRGRALVGEVVSAADGTPLAATIVARPQGGDMLGLVGESGADGRFEIFGALPEQRYGLRVSAVGYRDRQVGRVRLPGLSEPDEPVRVELLPALVVNVRVVDAAGGAPIEGARVSWAESGWGADRNGLRTGDDRVIGATDASGALRIEGVEDPDRGLLAQADGYAPDAERIDVGRDGDDAEVAEVDVLFRLDGGVALRVEVVSAAGPVAGADVELRQSDARSTWFLRGAGGVPDPNNVASPLLARARTDAEGRATFDNLPRDEYALAVRAGGYGRAFADELDLREALRTFDHRVWLTAASALEGVVTVRGEPAADQLVVAVGASGFQHAARTDEAGAYALEGLAGGPYRVTAHRSFDRSTLEALALLGSGPPDDRSVEIALAEGETRRLDLEGERAGLQLTGTLRIDHDPRPGTDVRAQLVTSDVDAARSRGRDDRGGRGGDRRRGGGPRAYTVSATTDADGRYVLEGLAPGRWELYASTGGGGARRGGGGAHKLARTTIDVPTYEDVEQDLVGFTGTLEVSLAEKESGEARGNMRLVLSPDPTRGGAPGFEDDERWMLWVGRSGEQTFVDLPEGAFLLEGGDRRWVLPRGPVELRSGRPAQLERELEPRPQNQPGPQGQPGQ